MGFDEEAMRYLYQDSNDIIVINLDTYEQHYIPKHFLGNKLALLSENMKINVYSINGIISFVTLPKKISVKVIECDSYLKEQTITASLKPAKITNHIRIMVPQFINYGNQIIILS